MAQPLVSDELWQIVEPLIPRVQRRHRYPGRKRIDDRKVLTGILFRLEDRHTLGAATPGVGLRFGHDLLAAPARVAGAGRLAAPARSAARQAA